MTSEWTWDAARNLYYYWSPDESAFVYQDGTRITTRRDANPLNDRLDSSPRSDPSNPLTFELSRYEYMRGMGSEMYAMDISERFGGLSLTDTYSTDQQSEGSASQSNLSFETTPYTPRFANPFANQKPYENEITEESEKKPEKAIEPTTTDIFQTRPKKAIADKYLYRMGGRSQDLIKGTHREAGKLDPSFQIRKDPRKFFVIGRVIKVLWTETIGHKGKATDVKDSVAKAGALLEKVRWFVVIKGGRSSCKCLPIVTDTKTDYTKPGITKLHQGVIYTSEKKLQAPAQEKLDVEHEILMPVRVVPRREAAQEGTIAPDARINFAESYKLKHNVKVYDFGKVFRGHIEHLKDQWEYVRRNIRSVINEDDEQVEDEEGDELGEHSNELDEDSDELDENSDELDEVKVDVKSTVSHRVQRQGQGGYQHQTLDTPWNPSYQSTTSKAKLANASSTMGRKATKTPQTAIPEEDRLPPQFQDLRRHTETELPSQYFQLQTVSGAGNDRNPLQLQSDPHPSQNSAESSGTTSDTISSTTPQSIISDNNIHVDISPATLSEGFSDYGDLEFPTDVEPDERFVHPKRWRTRLEKLEFDVVDLFGFKNLSFSGDPFDIPTCIKILDSACASQGRMRDANYCGDAITCLAVPYHRPGIAYLRKIELSSFEVLKSCLEEYQENRVFHRAVQTCQGFIESLGLSIDLLTQGMVPVTDSTILEVVASFIARYSCVATIAYCGAHLEDFDETHLPGRVEFFRLHKEVIFHRQRLSCLDGLLKGRPVWVLEATGSGGLVQDERLSILTTIEALVDTWGPAWKITDIDKPEIFKRIGIGNGYIVPKEAPNSEGSSTDPEILCHWTADESETLDRASFPDDLTSCRLLIGAGWRLRTNKDCSLDAHDFTRRMDEDGRLVELGVSPPTAELQRTITTQLGGLGATVGYGESYKRRAGTSYREEMLTTWKMEPEKRNPHVLKRKLGVQVSCCTGNSHRCSLLNILGSRTVHNYLSSVGFWSDAALEQQYIKALNSSDPDTLPNLFLNQRDLRDQFGRAISLSLQSLKDTGTDSKDCLSALWAPTSEMAYNVQFPAWSYGWSGILRDSPNHFTMAVVSAQCLELDAGTWSSLCRLIRPEQEHSVLETALVVNEKANRPKGLIKREGADGSLKWSLRGLQKHDSFDMGDGCALVVVQYLKSSALCLQSSVIVGWKSAELGLVKMKYKAEDYVRKEALKMTEKKRHYEMHREHKWETQPIPVYVVSHPKLVS